MRRIRYVYLGLAFLVLGNAWLMAGEMIIKARQKEGSLIEFTITNHTSKTVYYTKLSLPWGHEGNAELESWLMEKPFIEDGKPLAMLPRKPLVEEPDVVEHRRMLIAPGASISGTIDLKNNFPGLDEKAKTSCYLWFWRYSSPGSNGMYVFNGESISSVPLSGSGVVELMCDRHRTEKERQE